MRVVVDDEMIGGRLDETDASLQAVLRRALELPASADPLTWTVPASDHLTARPRVCAKIAGFSLHAGQAVAADDREALERLGSLGAPSTARRGSLASPASPARVDGSCGTSSSRACF